MNETKKILPIKGVYKGKQKHFFVVDYKDTEYYVPMFKYQIANMRDFTELHCMVKEDESGVIIKQDFEKVFNDIFEIGQTYTFRVKNLEGNFYNVADSNGIIFKLRNAKGMMLREGQNILAKVKNVKLVRVELEFVDQEKEDSGIDFKDFDSLKQLVENPEESAIPFQNIIENNYNFAEIKKLYYRKDGAWLPQALLKLDQMLIGYDDELDVTLPLVSFYQKLCVYTLEESDILRRVDSRERSKLIKMLAQTANHADDYKAAHQIMEEGKAREYVDHQLTNLKESENLYRAESKFRIMMTIFNNQEALMDEMMDRIFDIIIEGDQKHWLAEPFRSAFVNMLELFVNQYRDKAVRTPGNRLIHKLIRALAIQQLLANDSDDIDRRLNFATYLRMLSYVQSYASEPIIEAAFYTLFRPFVNDPSHNLADAKIVEALYYKAAYSPAVRSTALKTSIQPQIFRGEKMYFSVDNRSVTISQNSPIAEPCDLKGLYDWSPLEFRMVEPEKARPKDRESVTNEAVFWDTFNRRMMATASNVVRRRMRPDIGDYVNIKVTADLTSSEDGVLLCEIVDDTFSGKGFLQLDEITKYFKSDAKRSLMPCFCDSDGSPLLFYAKVIDEDPTTDEFEFSLLETTEDFFRHTLDAGTIIDCTLKQRINDPNGAYYLGFSELGLSVRVMVNDKLPENIGAGAYIQAEYNNMSPTGQMICSFHSDSPTSYMNGFNSFRNLLQRFGVPQEVSDLDKQTAYDAMDPDYLEEVVAIIDRMGVISKNPIHAYSFLNLASLLAQMGENDRLAEYYQKRKEISEAFATYERTGFVDEKNIETLTAKIGKEQMEEDYVFNEAITKFKILKALRTRDDLDTLLNIRQNTQNPAIRNAADLATSLLLLTRFELPNTARNITDQINKELNIKVKDSKLKDYGIEDQYKEFKTSIIYPAGNHMQPSPEVQGAVILRAIDAFLNSPTGGTLYLGVNDCGAACGLQNDFKYINGTEDLFSRKLHMMIRDELGQTANQLCTDEKWEKDGDYKVFILKVKPAAELIPFKGEFWIRQASEKIRLKPEDEDSWRQQRQREYNAYVKKHPEEFVFSSSTTAATSTLFSESTSTDTLRSRSIPTSELRQNITMPHEENYGINTQAFFHFLPGWKYKITDECNYEDTDLTLAIQNEEADGHLFIAYESGELLAVEMSEILDKTRDREAARCPGKEIFFAAPIKEDDEILTVWTGTTGDRYARIDPIQTIYDRHGNGSLTDGGALIADTKFNSLDKCEIVPKNKLAALSRFRNSGTRLGKRLGISEISDIERELKIKL